MNLSPFGIIRVQKQKTRLNGFTFKFRSFFKKIEKNIENSIGYNYFNN